MFLKFFSSNFSAWSHVKGNLNNIVFSFMPLMSFMAKGSNRGIVPQKITQPCLSCITFPIILLQNQKCLYVCLFTISSVAYEEICLQLKMLHFCQFSRWESGWEPHWQRASIFKKSTISNQHFHTVSLHQVLAHIRMKRPKPASANLRVSSDKGQNLDHPHTPLSWRGWGGA